ncbi:MAG TPA: hypothetical protein VGC29_08570 [Flavisolibacter sp.]
MKKFFLMVVAIGIYASATAQKTDSFYVIGKDLKKAVAWNPSNGRLLCFDLNEAGFEHLHIGNMVKANLQTKTITSVHSKNSFKIKEPHKAEPTGIIALIQADGADPVNGIIHARVYNADPINSNVDRAEPTGATSLNDIISKNLKGVDPINGIVSIEVDNAEPISSIITLKGKQGKLYRFRLPSSIAKTQKIGDPVYVEPVNGIAIIQSNAGGNLASYGYPIGTENASATSSNAKWEIKPNTLKGSSGRILIDNPEGSTWTIYFYTMPDEKYVTSFAESNNKGVFVLAPGEYKVTLNDVPVLNVPVKKAHDTRIKCGTLSVVSEGVFYIYDETKTTSFTSGNKPIKMPLPVGTYQFELNGQFQVLVIKEGEIVEM